MKAKICFFITMLFVLSLCAFLTPNNTIANTDSVYINSSDYCLFDDGFYEYHDYYNYDLFGIENEEQFKKFAELLTDFDDFDFTGKKVVLMNDLNLNGSGPSPSDSSSVFCGTFDGQGFAINNLRGRGLFFANDGTVMNVNLTNINLSSNNVGGIAVYNYGTIFNCNVVSGNIAGTNNAGGIVAFNEKTGTINYCQNNAAVSVTNSSTGSDKIVGGISARNLGEILNCLNAADIAFNISMNNSNINCVGGIAGCANFTTNGDKSLILNCFNLGNINISIGSSTGNSTLYIGGILGCYIPGSYSGTSFVLKNCYNKNVLTGASGNGNRYLGKICGYITTSSTVNIGPLYCQSEANGYQGIVGNGSASISANSVRVFNFNDTDYSLRNSADNTSLPIEINGITCGNLEEALNAYAFPDSRLIKWWGSTNNPPMLAPIHNVTFNTNGGEYTNDSLLNNFYSFEDILENQYYYFYEDILYNLSNLVAEKEGYNFIGWFDESGMQCETIFGAQKNLELFAKFYKTAPVFDVEWFDAEFTYNGSNLIFERDLNSIKLEGETLISGLLENDEIIFGSDGTIFFGNFPIIKNADTYEIYFKITRDGHDYIDSFTVTINKADISNITFSSGSCVYNGTQRSIHVLIYETQYGDSVAITYDNNGQTDAGTHLVTAYIKSQNYNDLVLTATLTIYTAKITLTWSDTDTFIYNGNNQNPAISNVITDNGVEILPEDIQITGGINAGNYTATASIDNNNYIIINPSKSFSIVEASITLTWSDTDTFIYNGNTRNPNISGILTDNGVEILPEDIQITGGINVGNYTATASIDNNNYIIVNPSKSFSIEEASIKIIWSGELIYNGQVQIPSYIVTDTDDEQITDFILSTKIVSGDGKSAGNHAVDASSEDGNYKILDGETYEYTIDKANVSVTIILNNWVEGENPNNYSTSNLPGEFSGVTPKVEYKLKSAADNAYSETKPTEIGEYTIRVTYSGTLNYNGFSVTTNFAITTKLARETETDKGSVDLTLVLACAGGGTAILLAILIIVISVQKRRNRFIKLTGNNDNVKK
ncbi:MAG: MBG domain-containing protein [Firmicutes bacterium]|nr:MBG domain-containing protein [Bacillota bacterium]